MPTEAPLFFSDPVWINDALQAGNTGLWKITIDSTTGQGQMFADTAMLRLLGLESHPSLEECYLWWFDRISPGYKDYVVTSVGEAFAKNQRVEVEYPWIHPTMGKLFVRCGGKPTPATDHLLHIMGYHQNITELHSARESLKKSLANLEMVCRMGNIGVFQLIPTPEASFTLVADSLFASQFAVDIDTPAPQLWSDIAANIDADMQDMWNAIPRWEARQTAERSTLEFLYQHPLQGPCWISLTCEYFFEQDLPVRAVGYVTDITSNKERELYLQTAKEQAEAASLSKSSFLANMSHEIRTPMNAVLNLAQLALNTELSAKQRDYISKIHYSGKLTLHILNDILDFSKIEANRMEIEKRIFAVEPELEYLLTMMEEWSHNKGLIFTSNIDPHLPPYIIGDDLRIRQILINLVSNALKFTEKGSIIFSIKVVDKQPQHARIAFTVQDMGIGMSEAEQARIFTAFTQADVSITRRFGGTGLGLTISNTLAKLMGGVISVESTLGVGSTFCLELPFDLPDADACRPDTSQTIIEQRDFTGMRVLIVEDNEINQEVMIAMLEELHVVCTLANNGQEAVKTFADDQSFDCIFMDVQMPIMDGYTATKAIRQSGLPRARTIPIIAMTANAMRGDDDKSLKAGMNAHLTKPMEIDKLVLALSQWGRPFASSSKCTTTSP